MKPKFGIIGCGGISRFHFAALEKTGAEVTHVCDIKEETVRAKAKELGVRYSTDYKKLLADPEVTAVNVLTGSPTHLEICRAALLAGKDIICEKTMTNNAAEGLELVKAARASGKLFFTAFMKRFFPAAQKAKELLPSLGTLFSAQARSYQAWGDFYNSNDPGEYDFVLGLHGGAAVKCIGSHLIDLVLWLLGRPESLYAHVDYIPGTRFDRKAMALFEYAGGMAASFEAVTHPLGKIGYERNSWDECVQINGTKGRIDLYTVMWDHPTNNAALLTHYDEATKTSTEYRFDAVNTFELEIAYFYDCLVKRVQGSPDVVDGYMTDAVIDAIINSADKKMPVALPKAP